EGHAGGLTPQQSDALRKIERAGTALMRLISDLLDLSRLKLGRARLETGVHDAVALAQRALGLVGEPPDGVVFRLVEPDAPVSVETDAEKVVKILENLLSNAFKFTSRGEVKLTVRRAAQPPGGGVGAAAVGSPPAAAPWVKEQDRVEWVVEDTGIGIAEEALPVIFDEFRQVDGSSTR